jgi:hypothetical protein
MKGNMVLIMVVAISLVSIAVSVNEVFAVGPQTAFISNVIIIPEKNIKTDVKIGELNFKLPPANSRGQSPFIPVTPGTYDITLGSHEGYTIADVQCVSQNPDGSKTPFGKWDGENTVSGAVLAKAVANICKWTFKSTG